MAADSKSNKIEQLFIEVHRYAELRTTRAKLVSIDSLSTIFSAVIACAIAAFFVGLTVILITILLTNYLSELFDSMSWGLISISLIYIAVAFMFYRLKHKLFADSMVRVLCKAFFPEHHK
ncbi:MAG: hypothetical protein R3Y15_06870 [Rikenellaceae bacterium]